MHLPQQLALACAGLGTLITLIPWLIYGSSIHGDLWITFGLFALMMLAIPLAKARRPIRSWLRWFLALVAVLVIVAAAVNLHDLRPVRGMGTLDPFPPPLAARFQLWNGCYLGAAAVALLFLVNLFVPWEQEVPGIRGRTLAWAGLALGLLLGGWMGAHIGTYVPASQATADRIDKGMSRKEVWKLFGRPPFQDSNEVLRDGPRTRQLIRGDDNARSWDGPEGMITVWFDRDDRVDKVAFEPSEWRVNPFTWLRSRLGWWP
jgi:hypothetical protein